MPQLEAHDWAPQLIWLAITFIGLYIIMAKAVIPRIGGVLEQRRDKIADDLDQAQSLKNETEKAIADYEAALAEARAKAHAIAEETRSSLKAETDKQARKLEATLDVKMAEAEERIKSTKDAAMAQVRDVAAEVAGVIVKEMIGGSVTKAKVKAALKNTDAPSA
jgi:F-type H+-transporting ATPase subunit b